MHDETHAGSMGATPSVDDAVSPAESVPAPKYRNVARIVEGTPAVDGAGVHLVRVIGRNDVADFDPFLMLDAFDSENPADYTAGFPWHPHRGIETITYLIQGDIEHGDSLGNSGSIKDGDCQWMTAGSGIIHQEMPQASPRMLGAQLWLNLPAAEKMTDASYGDIKRSDVPTRQTDTATVRIIGGKYEGVLGGFAGRHVPMTYLDVSVEPEGVWEYTSDEAATLFVYLVRGAAAFEPENSTLVEDHRAVLFSRGKKLHVRAGGTGVRLLLFEARPLREPVAWGGPIVMNTDEELRLAFAEIEQGTFVKHA